MERLQEFYKYLVAIGVAYEGYDPDRLVAGFEHDTARLELERIARKNSGFKDGRA